MALSVSRPTIPLRPRALALYRLAHGVTQREIADYLGYTSHSNLSGYEAGRYPISAALLTRILDAIDVIAQAKAER